MKKILVLSLSLGFLLSSCFIARRVTSEIVLQPKTNITYKHTTLDKVSKAIEEVAIKYNWTIVDQKPSSTTLKLNTRDHEAVVEIKYSTNEYQILYVSSVNLHYNPEKNTIHYNYNKWVRTLNTRIYKAL